MIQIKRGLANFLQIEPSRSSVHVKKVMGDDKITLAWEQAFITQLTLSDYILHEGTRYKLNTLPTVKKLSTKLFQYNAVFEAPQYDLLKVAYMFTDGGEPEGEFSLTGNADTFMELLITNLARVYPEDSWEIGSVLPDTEYITLTFSFENCMSVLTRLAAEFNTEFSFVGNIINFTKVSTERLVTLRYKRTSAVIIDEHEDAIADNANLYDIERVSVDSSSVVTRLYPFGSSKNLGNGYRGGAARLTVPYIDSPNAAIFGIIEASKNFEHVYPRLELTGAGVVQALGDDEFEFIDDNIDFNVNDCLLSGTPAKIKFLTGPCAGYDFQIRNFDYASYTFKILPNTDDKDFQIPSITIKPQVGNQYVLLDIIMPPAYVAAAESELTAEATKYLITEKNDSVKVAYRVKFSQIYAKLHAQDIECGDTVTVYDPDIAVNEKIRIVQLTRNMAQLSDVDIELSNTITATTFQRITTDIVDLKNTVVTTEAKINKNTLSGYRNAKELREMVFDPDGYFDPENIRPLSIETSMLSVGSRSQSFQLTCVVKPNTGANPQIFSWTAGVLAHFTIADTIKLWSLPSGSLTLTGGNTTSALYIYAKCSRTTTEAVLYLDVAAIKFDANADFYYFLVGVLHSPISGVRGISLTYGQTTINGQFIQTGVIRSIDGLTYFDLNNGEIGGNIKFKSGQTPEDLEDDIDAILQEIEGFGSDGIITPAEKRELKIQWDTIVEEFQPLYNQGDSLGCLSFEDYSDAYGYLGYYLNEDPNLLNPANMQLSSTVVVSTYKSLWASFFKLRATLRTEIAAAINNLVDIVASDGVLTPAEKLQIKSMWDGISADYGTVNRRATAAEVTTFTIYTTFTAKYNALASFLSPILANMGNNSLIDATTFKTRFSDYATAKSELVKFLDERNELTTAAMIINIDKALSDSWITPAEKLTLKIQWDIIVGEYFSIYNQASDLGCDEDFYEIGYTNLENYIASISLFSDMSTSTFISNVVTFRAYWISYYQRKEILKAEINDKLNIKASSADYLKEAMAGSTDITGGLLLTNLLLMKSSAENIRGGMSGLYSDPVGYWLGGTYPQATADAARPFKSVMETAALDKKSDGSGHRAFGNLAWNAEGDVFVKGIIEALGGKIGNLSIIGNELINGNVRITNEAVPSLPTLFNPTYVSLDRETSWTGTYGTEGRATTQSFTSTEKSELIFALQSTGEGSGYGWYYEIRKFTDNIYSYTVEASGYNTSSYTNDAISVFLQPGNYYIYARPWITSGGSPAITISGAPDSDAIIYRYYEQRTILAQGGFFSFFSPTSYFYFKQNEMLSAQVKGCSLKLDSSSLILAKSGSTARLDSGGISLQVGNRILNINGSSIRKSSDGGYNWTNL